MTAPRCQASVRYWACYGWERRPCKRQARRVVDGQHLCGYHAKQAEREPEQVKRPEPMW